MIKPIQTPITGNKDQGDLSSPYHAPVQFYYAFNHHGSIEDAELLAAYQSAVLGK